MANVTTIGTGFTQTTKVVLNFNGYYQEKQIGNIKEVDGIYAAFACTLSKDKEGKECCTPLRCIYIGMGTGTDNVHVRVGKHKNDDHPAWKKHLNEGEHILYSYAECSADILHDVEAALIYRNQPEENEARKDSYTGSTHLLTVESPGNIGTLKKIIVVL